MRTAIIATVFNEQNNIGPFIESLLDQSKLPDEIIIVDGESIDSTADIIQSYININPLIKLIVKKCNIAQGRNIAIAHSTADLIASTDAGCIIDKYWFENITDPLLNQDKVAVMGNFTALGNSTIQRSLCVIVKRRNPQRNYPSSRSFAFKKELWAQYPYPEDLVVHEDTKLCYEWSQLGVEFYFAKEALVYWNVESNYKSIFKKYCRYSLWHAFSGDPLGIMKWLIIIFYIIQSIIVLWNIHFAVVVWCIYGLVRILRSNKIKETYKYLKISGILTSIPVIIVLDFALIWGTICGKYHKFFYNAVITRLKGHTVALY